MVPWDPCPGIHPLYGINLVQWPTQEDQNFIFFLGCAENWKPTYNTEEFVLKNKQTENLVW